MTIGETISRLRTLIKSVKQDAALSDRFLYSLIMKYGKLLMRRQDNLNHLMRFDSIFQPLDFVELIDIDVVQAACRGVHSSCTFKRTKNRLPDTIDGYWGPMLRNVSSLDLSQEIIKTSSLKFSSISHQNTFKYNKNKYFWFLDGHLYFPNLSWDAIRIEGVFEGDISYYNCDTSDDCIIMQEKQISIPDFLFAEIEQMALKELTMMISIPIDNQHDQKNIVT